MAASDIFLALGFILGLLLDVFLIVQLLDFRKNRSGALQLKDPTQVTVEVVSHSDVKRLDAQDAQIRKDLKSISARIDGIHSTLYELMGVIQELKRRK